jgi:hypothetical protein
LLVVFAVIPPALAEKGRTFIRGLVAKFHERFSTRSADVPTPTAAKK